MSSGDQICPLENVGHNEADLADECAAKVCSLHYFVSLLGADWQTSEAFNPELDY